LDGFYEQLDAQYGRDREIPGHPEIFFPYAFTGELQTIYTTLVVRLWYSREFQHKERWQDIAEFNTAKEEPDGLGSLAEEIALAGKFFVPKEQKITDPVTRAVAVARDGGGTGPARPGAAGERG
jgi:hypothetical protein